MKNRSIVSTIGRALLLAVFACGVVVGSGCSQNCSSCTTCPANCDKPCCAKKTAEACPPGCQKPCCKKA